MSELVFKQKFMPQEGREGGFFVEAEDGAKIIIERSERSDIRAIQHN